MLGHLGYGRTVGLQPVPFRVDSDGIQPADPELIQLVAAFSGPLSEGTDRSGVLGAGGVAQTIAPANAARRGLDIQNIGVSDLWVSENGVAAAPGVPGSWRIQAGQAYSVATNRAISIVGSNAGQAWTATEY